MLNIKDLILDKKKNNSHNSSEIDFIISSYLKNKISDQYMTDWLKEILKNGMSNDETFLYTKSIINSGERINFDSLNGYVIDKHSTGGIGDKVSLILGPILAACGCYVPMVVGRFLGHTGGTLDKLESINGYNGFLELNEFKKIVKNVGISIIGQTDQICPADRKIYALRDKTNTVASFPLICGSIMSKKIAEGIQGLILDIKTGNGAFISSDEEGEKLGELLSFIGSQFNLKVKYLTTDMNQPLGNFAGLKCEIIESIESLKGNGPKDLMNIVMKLGKEALTIAKIPNSKEKITGAINDGSALEIFYNMISEHKGNLNDIDLSYKYNIDITAERDGIFNFLNTKKIGDAINFITLLNGKKDVNAGAEFFVKNGSHINQGDIILRFFSNNSSNLEIAKKLIHQSYIIH